MAGKPSLLSNVSFLDSTELSTERIESPMGTRVISKASPVANRLVLSDSGDFKIADGVPAERSRQRTLVSGETTGSGMTSNMKDLLRNMDNLIESEESEGSSGGEMATNPNQKKRIQVFSEQQKAIHVYQKQVSEQEDLIRGYQMENERLYSQLQKAEKHNKMKIESYEAENQKLRAEAIQLKEKLNQMEMRLMETTLRLPRDQRNSTPTPTRPDATLELEETWAKVKSQERELTSLRDQKSATEAALETARRQMNVLMHERQITESKLARDLAELETKFENQLSDLQSKVKWYEGQGHVQGQSQGHSKSTTKDDDDVVKRLQSQVEFLQQENGSLKSVKKSLKSDERSAYIKRIQDLEKQIREAATAATASVDVRKSLQLRASHDVDLDLYVRTNKLLEERIHRLEDEVQSKEDEKVDLLREVKAHYELTKSKFEETIRMLEDEVRRLRMVAFSASEKRTKANRNDTWTQTQEGQRGHGQSDDEQIIHLLMENSRLKSQLEEAQKRLAASSSQDRGDASVGTESLHVAKIVETLRKDFDKERQQLIVSLTQATTKSPQLGDYQSVIETQNVIIEHLRKKLNDEAVDRESIASATIKLEAALCENEKLKRELAEAYAVQAPAMKQFRMLTAKIAKLEETQKARTTQLESATSTALSTSLPNDSHWRELLRKKNEQIEQFRHELDQMMLALRELKRKKVNGFS